MSVAIDVLAVSDLDDFDDDFEEGLDEDLEELEREFANDDGAAPKAMPVKPCALRFKNQVPLR